MPYVTIVKDFANVQPEIFLGLSKRQLIAAAISLAIAAPVYWLLHPRIGIFAFLLIILLILPVMFFGFSKLKDGRTPEKIFLNYVKVRYLRPAKRPYRTKTIYSGLEAAAKIREVIDSASAGQAENQENKKAGSLRKFAKGRKKENRQACKDR